MWFFFFFFKTLGTDPMMTGELQPWQKQRKAQPPGQPTSVVLRRFLQRGPEIWQPVTAGNVTLLLLLLTSHLHPSQSRPQAECSPSPHCPGRGQPAHQAASTQLLRGSPSCVPQAPNTGRGGGGRHLTLGECSRIPWGLPRGKATPGWASIAEVASMPSCTRLFPSNLC